MAKYLSTDKLIESIARRAMIPKTQKTFEESDFLAFINEEMDLYATPLVLSFHQDYFLRTLQQPLVANTSNYNLPPRAIGDKLRDVAYLDANGNWYEMSRVTIEDVPIFQGSYTSKRIFYMKGNELVILPQVYNVNNDYLQYSYYLRPNEIVAESRVGMVQSFNTTTGLIVFSDLTPSNITVGSLVDIVGTASPHKTKAMDLVVQSIGTNTVTLVAANLPPDLTVGDHVATAGETIVPQIPSELHPLLAQTVACRCLESLNDQTGLDKAMLKLQSMEKSAGFIVADRVEGAPQKVVNRRGFIRNSWRRRFW